MRRFVGFLVSLVLALAIVAAMWALKPTFSISATRDSLAKASEQLEQYPFTPLIGELRVYSLSWKKWVSEVDDELAAAKKTGDHPLRSKVDENAPVFRKGAEGITERLALVSAATIGGPLLFWLAVLLMAKVFPKVEGSRYLAGRFVLIVGAVGLAGVVAPVIVCEGATGLVFALPTVIGAITGWALRPKT
ncbi:MAG: hypothetical protein ACXVEE_31620 [Polyangiales bacterium]